MLRRVVVTGVGLVTPLGVGKDDFSRHLFGGVSGIRPITLFDTARFDAKLGAQVRDFTPQDFIRSATLRRMDRLSQMANSLFIVQRGGETADFLCSRHGRTDG